MQFNRLMAAIAVASAALIGGWSIQGAASAGQVFPLVGGSGASSAVNSTVEFAGADGSPSQLSVQLQGLRAHATYLVYECSFPALGAAGCIGASDRATVTTDATGAGQATLTFGSLPSVDNVAVANQLDVTDIYLAATSTVAGDSLNYFLSAKLGDYPTSVYTPPEGYRPGTPSR
jgi:hypothetical protein